MIDWLYFPKADTDDYGVNVKINTIYKGKKGKWVVEEDWGVVELTTGNFDTKALIDILGIVVSIFDIADGDYGGKVFGAGEYIEDKDND